MIRFMFWGMSEPWWLALWGGVIGSFVAAILGGLVALIVVRLTNRHQSRIAATGREHAAAADMTASCSAIVKLYDQGPHAIRDFVLQVEAAAFRWAMEGTHSGLAKEIHFWPNHVGFRGLELAQAREHSDETEANKAFDRLASSVAMLETVVLQWPTADRRARDGLVEQLRQERLANTPPKEE